MGSLFGQSCSNQINQFAILVQNEGIVNQNVNQNKVQNMLQSNKQVIPKQLPPRPYQKKVLWVDKNASEQQRETLNKYFIIHKRESVEEAIEYLIKANLINQIPVICAGSMAKSFLDALDQHTSIKYVNNVYIFCFQISKYESLKANPRVKCVVNTETQIIEQIKKNIRIVELSNFRKLADSTQRTAQLKYSYLITALTRPILENSNRKQLISRFTLWLQRQSDSQDQIEYSNQVKDSQLIKIYTGDGVYSYLNTLSRSQDMLSIENTHILISDLHELINKHSTYECRSKIPTLLFRGGFLNESQLNTLPQYLNSDIEFLYFLSTSKAEEVGIEFTSNTLFTIYIPAFFVDSESRQIKIRGGYLDTENFQVEYKTERQVIFNIKTNMTPFRLTQFTIPPNNQNQYINLQLVYGLDQILCFLRESQTKFEVYTKRPDKLCSKCPLKDLHLIGTESKQVICLKDLKYPLEALLQQSFVLVNKKKDVCGMIIKYKEEVQQNIAKVRNNQTITSSNLCNICRSKVKCQSCLKLFCLCTLETHDKSHLQNSHILVQGEVPRFISVQSRTNQLNLYITNREIQQKILYVPDGLVMSKDELFMNEAEKRYSSQIQSAAFRTMDYRVQYHLFFNRAESRRLKKYIKGYKITEQQLEKCLYDYKQCYKLVESRAEQINRRSKALLHIGIILDDLAQQDEKIQKKYRDENKLNEAAQKHNQAMRKYQQAMQKYKQAMQVLLNIENERDLNIEQLNTKNSIINCRAFIYWHNKEYSKGAQQFKNALDNLKLLKKDSKADQAKLMNNLTCILNQWINKRPGETNENTKRQAFESGKRSYQLRLCIFGSDHSLTKSSQHNYNKAKLVMQAQQLAN